MKVFVTGGSGFVGGHLLRRLKADGHQLVALGRSDPAIDRVQTLGADAVRGDLSDVGVLAAGMEGSEVVFHCAAWVGSQGDRAIAMETNVAGTSNLIAASKQAGVRRLVHLSTESVLIDGSPLDGVDESIPVPESGHLSVYAETKALAEKKVLAANGDGLETIALRPRLIWGPEDGTWLPGLVEKVERGVFRWVDDGKHLASTCHVYNVVEAMMLAADRGSTGEAYFITDGPPRPFREFGAAYMATAGIEVGDGSVPGWLMRGAGALLEGVWRILPTKSAPPINRVEAYMVSHPQVFDDSKAREQLGYHPVIGVEEGLAELAEG